MAVNMQMLTKFESHSSRVKGIAMHGKRPWILAALHNGCIQLWDYRMGTLLERFDEHDGPVRGIAFHSSQPLFASGGDDYKVKVWNYKTRRCLFTLNGHLDYIRTVFFHHEYPWIISASDDQTIRIWNWQSRQCIAILTGHNHYVMCAQFHPREDLIVSAALDLTVRVWDISGLRKKNTTAQTLSYEDQINRANNNQADLFGSTDAIVKYVLEGHDRGVNWAAFHPTLPLIISGADDRQVKLWRMSDSKAWEVDTCRGHYNNVMSALFHPRQDLIVSAGEDKTIRVWDMHKRTAIQTFRREHDRFWVLSSHPELNLFAAGHDNGLIVFKLERERPAFALHGSYLFYVRERHVRCFNFETQTDAQLLSIRKLGTSYIAARTLSYNPAEKSILVTTEAEGGLFELAQLPRDFSTDNHASTSTAAVKKGSGAAAIFITRNRFVVFDKAQQKIEMRDLQNTVIKTVPTPQAVTEIFAAGSNSLLLSTGTSVLLFDLAQQAVSATVQTPPVKYIFWSNDGNSVALMSKHTITISPKNLESGVLIHETIRLKSGTWDDSGVFIYSTLNHIKYALPNGDSGIIKTLEQPIYLTRIRGKTVFFLDREAKSKHITIDPTEFRFKLALVQKNYDEVLRIIRTSNLVGQSIIAYLQKKGYPDVALNFVQDKKTRFDLALECGNLDVALEMAKALDRPAYWQQLSEEALKQGAHHVVETAYQRGKNFERLTFLYLATGNENNLRKMQKIMESRGDHMAAYHNTLYTGDVRQRIQIFREVGQVSLAYLTARTNGLDTLAQEILANAGMTEAQVAPHLPKEPSKALQLPKPLTSTFEQRWPSTGIAESFFVQAMTNGFDEAVEPTDEKELAVDGRDEEGWEAEEEIDGELALEDGVEEGWDLDAGVEVDNDDEAFALPNDPDDLSVGITESELWIRNSPLAADHIAAGAMESAMELLHKQIGVVDFKPLKPFFLAINASSKVYLTANPLLPPLEVHLRRDPTETAPRKLLPIVITDLKVILGSTLQEAYRFVKAAKFEEALRLFHSILLSLAVVVARTREEATQITELVSICREYILGLSMEVERRKLAAEGGGDSNARCLELAAYFTHCHLQDIHLQLALRSAMVVFYKAKNFASAGHFASRFLETNPTNAAAASQAKQIQTASDRNPRDEVTIDYDPSSPPRAICAASYTMISASDLDSASGNVCQSPFSGAYYHQRFKGQVCRIDRISQIGLSASGLRSIV